MATPFSDVYSQFLSLVKDYRLTALYNLSPTHIEFENYVESWLMFAIRDFTVCDQSLIFSGTNFTTTLTLKNILMLAQLLKKYWLEKEINDITQMNLHILDKDFKIFSESQNIIAKQSKYNDEKEEISQLLVDYALRYSTDWSAWFSQSFYAP